MRADHPSVYPYSAAEAKRRNELDSWSESFRMNVSCKEAIEDAVRSNFNGMHLNEHCVDDVIEQFGFKRTMWVLSNTIQHSLSFLYGATLTSIHDQWKNRSLD